MLMAFGSSNFGGQLRSDEAMRVEPCGDIGDFLRKEDLRLTCGCPLWPWDAYSASVWRPSAEAGALVSDFSAFQEMSCTIPV